MGFGVKSKRSALTVLCVRRKQQTDGGRWEVGWKESVEFLTPREGGRGCPVGLRAKQVEPNKGRPGDWRHRGGGGKWSGEGGCLTSGIRAGEDRGECPGFWSLADGRAVQSPGRTGWSSGLDPSGQVSCVLEGVGGGDHWGVWHR